MPRKALLTRQHKPVTSPAELYLPSTATSPQYNSTLSSPQHNYPVIFPAQLPCHLSSTTTLSSLPAQLPWHLLSTTIYPVTSSARIPCYLTTTLPYHQVISLEQLPHHLIRAPTTAPSNYPVDSDVSAPPKSLLVISSWAVSAPDLFAGRTWAAH